jgi:trigger factor
VTLAEATLEEFKSDLVSARVKRDSACRIELEVTAASKLVQDARRHALKTVNKEVTFPGYRKGKAPDELIFSKYPQQVDKEIHNHLADLAFVEAQKQTKIPVLNNNSSISFKMNKLDENEAELSFSFETEPALPVVDAKQFTPKPVTRPEVGDKQIDEAIHQMLYYYAQWTPVLDRAIQDGDTIIIDLDTKNGETYTNVFNHIRFEVSKQRMANWMKELVAGAKSGAVLFGTSRADDTATEAEKEEFLPKEIRLTIIKVEKAELPVLDDAFAQKVGAPDVASMKKSITDMLNAQADQKARDAAREQINDFLVDTYNFDLPTSLVETERKHRFEQHMQNEKFKKSWEAMPTEEKGKIEAKLIRESAQAVRLFYLSRKVISDAKIQITHQEVQDEAVTTMSQFKGMEGDKIPKEIYALALSKIILAKAQDHLIEAQKA